MPRKKNPAPVTPTGPSASTPAPRSKPSTPAKQRTSAAPAKPRVKRVSVAKGEEQPAAKPKAAKPRARRAAKATTTTPPKPVGRPSAYTDELGAEICERIALGETLTSICTDDDKPNPTTVWRWQEARPEFRNAIAGARVEQTRAWADEMVALSRDSSRDMIRKTKESGEVYETLDREHVERVKLRINTLQWLMVRANRADFGDRSQIDHNVSIEGADTGELVGRIRDGLEKLGIRLEADELAVIGL